MARPLVMAPKVGGRQVGRLEPVEGLGEEKLHQCLALHPGEGRKGS